MKQNNKKLKQRMIRGWMIGGLMMLTLPWWLVGCLHEEYPSTKGSKEELSLVLKIPLEPSVRGTRADGENEQRADHLRFVVFKQVTVGAQTEEQYAYEAEVTKRKDVLVDGEATIYLNLQVAIADEESKFRVVALVNSYQEDKGVVGMSKEVFLKRFLCHLPEKWPTEGAIPMWGETAHLITFNAKNMVYDTSIKLMRALARVDVGLNFSSTTEGAEVAEGLDNFKLSSVRVYRSFKTGYMAPMKEHVGEMGENNPIALSPSVDLSWERRKDAEPLVYSYEEGGGVDQVIREIYIPEAPKGETLDDAVCLVIGGFFKGSATPTYYRADFAEYRAGEMQVEAYKDVLRNNRYLFNIRRVSSPGFETPEEALNSIPVDMELEVKAWEIGAYDFEVNGDHFFGLDRKVAYVGPEAEMTDTIRYRTNLALSGGANDRFKVEWKEASQTDFEVSFDYSAKRIILKSLKENKSFNKALRTQTLFLTVANFRYEIVVNQYPINGYYLLYCGSIEVHGVYDLDQSMTSSHSVDVLVGTANGRSIKGYSYSISTGTVNGIRFIGEGKFPQESLSLTGDGKAYRVRLYASGRVAQSGTFSYRLTCNSMEPNQTCGFEVAVAYRRLTVLSVSGTSGFGYAFDSNSNARLFVESARNFGMTDQSVVKARGFDITHTSSQTTFKKEITAYPYPDIVISGYGVDLDHASATEVYNYLLSGGVYICFHENEYYELMRLVFRNDKLKTPSTGTSSKPFFVNPDIDDLITNGPFGDMRGVFWGEDLAAGDYIPYSDIDPNEVYIYSTNVPAKITNGIWNSFESGDGVYMFRHKTLNLFFCGDGGFLSNADKKTGTYNSSTICPYAIDRSTGAPVVKYNYTSDRVGVYNSQLFGNIMAWAVKTAAER